MDKAAVIRSVVGATDRHEAFQCNTGWLPDSLQSIGGRPSLGAVVSKLQGPVDPAIPPFVGLAREPSMCRGPTRARPGSSGRRIAPFQPDGPAMANMKLRIPTGPARRSPPAARELRRAEARSRRHRIARRRRLGHRARLRRADLQPAGRRPRPEPAKTPAFATATATASPTSSSTTARRRSTSIC